ncbi:MAG: NAAT family transporter [Candidatus Latescibacteria bacterium]|nr:NAAT family transporter [Candidatus Latescibacterota bacterium]
MRELCAEIVRTSVALFVIIDPLGGLPIFTGLLRDMPDREQRKTIRAAVLVSFAILVTFSTVGRKILGLFDVGLNELQIGGGLMLLIIALDQIFGILPKRPGESRDVGIVPIACPLLAGPGAITTIMLTMERVAFPQNYAVALISAILTLSVVYLILSRIHPLSRLFGRRGSLVLSKLMGIILTAIATSFIVQGVMALGSR